MVRQLLSYDVWLQVEDHWLDVLESSLAVDCLVDIRLCRGLLTWLELYLGVGGVWHLSGQLLTLGLQVGDGLGSLRCSTQEFSEGRLQGSCFCFMGIPVFSELKPVLL